MRLSGLPLWALWSLVGVSVVLISSGAQLVVEMAARIAQRLKVSELVVGLTLVAAGTSLPEFGVTLVAAFENRPGISVGNIVGSNIFNLGFILGAVALIRPIPTTRILVRRDGTALILSTALLLLLVIPGLSLDRVDGFILLVGLAVYLAIVFRDGWVEWVEPGREAMVMGHGDHPGALASAKAFGGILAGFVLLGFGSHLLVNSAVPIAHSFGLSQWVIGVTVVAAATSSPEFSTALVGVLRKRYDISVGNVIGSDLFNLLGVLGIAGLFYPQAVEPEATASLVALMLMVLLVVVLARTGWKLTRLNGLTLLVFAFGRWMLEFATRVGP